MFIIDTCFWNHIRELFETIEIDLRPLIQQLNWGFTDALMKEYQNYELDKFISLESGVMFPITERTFSDILQKNPTIKELDLSDQTIYVSAIRLDLIVLSDDGELIMECLGTNIKAFRLPSFMLFLAESGKIKKKEVKQALNFWKLHNLYKLSELKKWETYLMKIQ